MPSATATAAPPAQPTELDPGVRAPVFDHASWADLAEQHYRTVYRLAYRLTGQKADAEDLTQETFFRVFRSLDSYRPDGSFEGWLYRITTNLFLDAKRREARMRLEALGDEAGQVEDPGSTPERLVEAMSLDTRLDKALSQLSPDLREALMMCDVEGKSYQEIADSLGVCLGTVRSRLHRARAQARCAMAD
jgi:RNA polymerase sigma-70 factor (ECF subfamily)